MNHCKVVHYLHQLLTADVGISSVIPTTPPREALSPVLILCPVIVITTILVAPVIVFFLLL